MPPLGPIELAVLFTSAFIALVVFPNARKIVSVLNELFRGGPRPPSHPIPGDDSVIVNRRRTRASR